jgi:hypothetical protein
MDKELTLTGYMPFKVFYFFWNQPMLSRQKKNDLIENRELMMVVSSWSIVLMLGRAEQERGRGR